MELTTELNDEQLSSSGEPTSDKQSKTGSTTKQSQAEQDRQLLLKKLMPRLRKWSALIVNTALMDSGQLASRQLHRQLIRKQYKHMLTLAKKMPLQELTSLLEESGFVEELDGPKLILPRGVKN